MRPANDYRFSHTYYNNREDADATAADYRARGYQARVFVRPGGWETLALVPCACGARVWWWPAPHPAPICEHCADPFSVEG